ncbi:MAG: hypothetical protein ABR567_20465 [Myxococcales bacterium]|nr:hypothetical protein [Myxococcales bacterium]
MLLAVLALLAAPTTPAIAPLTASYDPLAKGSMGFSFAFPGGGYTPVGTGSTIGITYLLNDNMAARVDFGLDAVVSPSGTPVVFNIGIGLRAYQLRRGPVAIYIFPQFNFGRVNGGAGGATEFITLSGGAGAEYFFADHFSVGGQLGVGLNFGNLGGAAGSSVITQLTTATSGLFASVYF